MRTPVILPPVLTLSHHEVLTAAGLIGEIEVVNIGEPELDVMAQYGVKRVFVPEAEIPELVTPAQVAEAVAQIAAITGRSEPDVIS